MADLASTQLRKGTVFEHEERVLQVITYKHVKKGRGLATIRVKVRDVETGAIMEKTFTSNEKVDSIALTYSSVQFLYADKNNAYFMNTDDFSQLEMPIVQVEDQLPYLKEGMKVQIQLLEGRPIGIQLPKKATYTVVETEPGVAGDTAGTATKKAKIETGVELQVPLFIEKEDEIIVNTEREEYVSKA